MKKTKMIIAMVVATIGMLTFIAIDSSLIEFCYHIITSQYYVELYISFLANLPHLTDTASRIVAAILMVIAGGRLGVTIFYGFNTIVELSGELFKMKDELVK